MHNIYWCEWGLQLADISTKNVEENYLNLIMKYILVRLDKWDRTLVKEGWHDTGDYVEQYVLYESPGFSWGLDSISFKC